MLVTGTKYYGSHLGPFKTPSREDDPRHAGANYYFDPSRLLTQYQKGKRWNWTELRPQTLCGFAPGTAMSIRAGDRACTRRFARIGCRSPFREGLVDSFTR